jgi:hypothetical protein
VSRRSTSGDGRRPGPWRVGPFVKGPLEKPRTEQPTSRRSSFQGHAKIQPRHGSLGVIRGRAPHHRPRPWVPRDGLRKPGGLQEVEVAGNVQYACSVKVWTVATTGPRS